MLGVPKPVSVEGIFTDLYILDKPTAFQRYDIDRLNVQIEEKDIKFWFLPKNVPSERRINAVELIQNSDRLFILGKPGAGKTTLMKYVTLLAAKGKINKIPIFVSLIDWAQSGKELIDYIGHQFEISSIPSANVFILEGLLTKGRAIVLFDGLDE
jgi:predicted NACHT family NTPase